MEIQNLIVNHKSLQIKSNPSAGSWSVGNSFARNVVIFGVDSRTSSHTDNCKNNF